MHARSARALRGTAATAVATVTAAAAHTLAGGGAPAPLLVGAVIVLAAPLAVALAGRTPSLWRTAVAVVAAQLLLHVAFALTAGLDPVSAAAHAHHTLLPSGPVDGVAIVPDLPMTFAHACAALVTILAVHRGERILRAVGRGLARLVTPPRDAVPAPAHRGGRVLVVPPARPTARVADFPLSRRGPPVLFGR